jgi:hypothetical protein
MARLPAILFRRKVYVGDPRHLDAIKKAFAGMSHHQQRRISNRIADGKESMLFGWVDEGGEWEPEPEFQEARMIMYGFE